MIQAVCWPLKAKALGSFGKYIYQRGIAVWAKATSFKDVHTPPYSAPVLDSTLAFGSDNSFVFTWGIERGDFLSSESTWKNTVL